MSPLTKVRLWWWYSRCGRALHAFLKRPSMIGIHLKDGVIQIPDGTRACIYDNRIEVSGNASS